MNMQMPDNQFDDRDEALQAPDALVSALRQMPGDRIFVPPTMDETVLRAARKHLEPAVKPSRTWTRFLPWAATAGAAVSVVFLVVLWPSPSRQFAREDLNRDGQVDILDAFTLAKQLQNGVPSASAADLNADGAVNQQDVAALAARAVALDNGGPS